MLKLKYGIFPRMLTVFFILFSIQYSFASTSSNNEKQPLRDDTTWFSRLTELENVCPDSNNDATLSNSNQTKHQMEEWLWINATLQEKISDLKEKISLWQEIEFNLNSSLSKNNHFIHNPNVYNKISRLTDIIKKRANLESNLKSEKNTTLINATQYAISVIEKKYSDAQVTQSVHLKKWIQYFQNYPSADVSSNPYFQKDLLEAIKSLRVSNENNLKNYSLIFAKNKLIGISKSENDKEQIKQVLQDTALISDLLSSRNSYINKPTGLNNAMCRLQNRVLSNDYGYKFAQGVAFGTVSGVAMGITGLPGVVIGTFRTAPVVATSLAGLMTACGGAGHRVQSSSDCQSNQYWNADTSECRQNTPLKNNCTIGQVLDENANCISCKVDDPTCQLNFTIAQIWEGAIKTAQTNISDLIQSTKIEGLQITGIDINTPPRVVISQKGLKIVAPGNKSWSVSARATQTYTWWNPVDCNSTLSWAYALPSFEMSCGKEDVIAHTWIDATVFLSAELEAKKVCDPNGLSCSYTISDPVFKTSSKAEPGTDNIAYQIAISTIDFLARIGGTSLSGIIEKYLNDQLQKNISSINAQFSQGLNPVLDLIYEANNNLNINYQTSGNSLIDTTTNFIKQDSFTGTAIEAQNNFKTAMDMAVLYLYNLETKFKSSNGLYYKMSDGVHLDDGSSGLTDGDSLIWNENLLATFCQIESWYERNSANLDPLYPNRPFDLRSRIDNLWQAFKTNLVTSDGRLVRDAYLKNAIDGDTISNDGIIGFYNLGAIAHYSNCHTVKNEFGFIAARLAKYAQDHNLKLEPSGITMLGSATFMNAILDLYGQPIPTTNWSDIPDLLSIQAILMSGSKNNPGLYSQFADCKIHHPDFDRANATDTTPLCTAISDSNIGGPSFHLMHLLEVVAYIYTKTKNTDLIYAAPVISPQTAITLMQKTAALIPFNVPDAANVPFNWLFVAAFRHAAKLSANDAITALLKFPHNGPPGLMLSNAVYLNPGVSNPICTDYVWQRMPFQTETCNGRNALYMGTDFLKLFAWIVQPHPDDNLNSTQR